MRELLFKALTSLESNKRDFRITETIEKDGVRAETTRRSMYFITGKVHIDDSSNIEKLSKLKLEKVPHKKRHSYVLKVHDSETGRDKLLCKVAGSFYAVCNNDVYSIAFIHSFKVLFTNLASNQKQ